MKILSLRKLASFFILFPQPLLSFPRRRESSPFNLLNFYILSSIFLSNNALAGNTGDLPFVSTLNTFKDAISGPFLLAASIIMIVATCIMLAFGEWGDGFKKMINIVMWLSIAFAATTFVTTMFGGGGAF